MLVGIRLHIVVSLFHWSDPTMENVAVSNRDCVGVQWLNTLQDIFPYFLHSVLAISAPPNRPEQQTCIPSTPLGIINRLNFLILFRTTP